MPFSSYQSPLESEIADLVAPDTGYDPIESDRPTTRQSALFMLSRCAQSVEDAAELVNAAATLAATTLELEVFTAADFDAAAKQITDRIYLQGDGNTEQLQSATRDASPAESAMGFALEAEHPIVVEHVERDRRFSDEMLVASGARSGIVCPIQYQDRKFGAIGVFSQTPHNFTKDDVLFVHSLALLLGPALAHRRAEKALSDQSKFLSAAIDSLESVVLLLNDRGEILRFNKACHELGGFSVEEAKLRTFWGTFLLPEEVAMMHNVFTRLKAGEVNVRCESFLLTKRGRRHRISWKFSQLPFKSERGPSIIASGIDVTEQFDALAKLDEMSGISRKLEEHLSNTIPETPGIANKDSLEVTTDKGIGIDHRAYPRRPYLYVQAIGACRNGKLPNRNEFFDVCCRDISPRGFSYITHEPPDFFEFVVTFGSPPALLYLKSRVVHVSPIVHDGRSCLLVGCEYIQRVELPD